MKKTIGGDRLGAGKKLQVELHNYERSTHDLGYIWRSTMSAGTLVPFMSEVGLPGDTFDIELQCDIKTHPTIGPLFGSYKVQLDVFSVPIRLYNSLMHNNMLGIGMNMSKVFLPTLKLNAKYFTTEPSDLDNSQINPSCLLSYLGIRGIGVISDESEEPVERNFNAVPVLAYWDIYKNYYANKQEEEGVVIHTITGSNIETVDDITFNGNTVDEDPTIGHSELQQGQVAVINFTGATPDLNQIMFNTSDWGYLSALEIIPDANWTLNTTAETWTGTYNETPRGILIVNNWRYRQESDPNYGKVALQRFDLSNIDEMRKQILAFRSETNAYPIIDVLPPYAYLGTSSIISSQEGLAIKTYQSDLFNNWIQTEWIDGVDGISAITSIDTSGGSFTIDTLNLSKKVYDMLNRIAISGGTYDDWLDSVYAHERYQRAESPIYCGGLSKELIFQEVVSNSQTEEQPLGSLAGKGIMSNKHKGGKVYIKVDEPSYIMGIVSLTPRIDYSQGNKWDVHLRTMDDLHKPALDEIGFQELITEQLAWWTTSYDNVDGWVQKSAGKQPAWLNYMTNVNRVYGNFAVKDNEMFMTLNRRYEPDQDNGNADITTYIDPAKYNFIFADTAIDSQNFWTQIAVDITARRKMSAKLMPNL